MAAEDPPRASAAPPLPDATSRFLSRLSHELRTPLGSILMLTELLADGADAGAAKNVGRIRQAATEMRGVLEDVSFLAKVEGGRIDLHPEPVAVVELADRWREEHRAKVEAAGRRFRLQLAEGLPETVETDPLRLGELVGLAVERAAAAAAGEVAVAIAPGDGGVTITVADDGPPIPEEDRAALFEPLGELRTPELRRATPRRLGLPIARALAHRLGGELTAEESTEGGVLVARIPG